MVKYYKLKALTNFFWSGDDGTKCFIKQGEEIEGDSAFKKQVVDEEGLCEVIE